MHDKLASTVALARTMLQSIDPNPAILEVRVSAASLKLVLDTFVEVAAGAASPLPGAKGVTQQAMAEHAQRGVAHRMAEFELENDLLNGAPRRGRL